MDFCLAGEVCISEFVKARDGPLAALAFNTDDTHADLVMRRGDGLNDEPKVEFCSERLERVEGRMFGQEAAIPSQLARRPWRSRGSSRSPSRVLQAM